MTKSKKLMFAVMCAVSIAVGLSACTDGASSERQDAKAVSKVANARHAYIPRNGVEFRNYNDAQKLYDSPDTIIWCSTTWGNASAPLVTVPVTGKLTSSTTSYFSPDRVHDGSGDTELVQAARSVDGMYHQNPPQYRFGFTPGGQYVDFFNMPTFCTTALTKFQREQTKVSLTEDPAMKAAQKKAEAALAGGSKAAAQKALTEGLGG